LPLATDCVDWKHWTFDIDEPDGGMVMCMLAAETELMLSEAFANVAGLAHVERSVRGFQDVDESASLDRFWAADFGKHENEV
jgi:hypothetical protein